MNIIGCARKEKENEDKKNKLKEKVDNWVNNKKQFKT